jgi:hypothetical protein
MLHDVSTKRAWHCLCECYTHDDLLMTLSNCLCKCYYMMSQQKKSLTLLDRQNVRVNVALSALSFNKKVHGIMRSSHCLCECYT